MNWMERRKRESRRRQILDLAAVSAVTTTVVVLAGLGLPPDHVTRGQLVLPRPPETVWRVLTDLDGMPQWRTDLRGLERLPDRAGHLAWREIGSGWARVLEIAESRPPLRLVVRDAASAPEAGALRAFDLTASQSGTLLTVTERRSHANPLRRVLVRLPLGRAEIATLLRDLEARLTVAGQLTAQMPD